MKYLCALEAVNLDNLFSDCEDLSTVRGGGLAVLDIATTVASNLKLLPDDIITQGASQGFLRVEGTSTEEVEMRVRQILHDSDPLLKHTTIMVAACPDGPPESFAHHRAELKAKMRWNQMQAPSVIYPEILTDQICAIDKVRPARGKHSDFTEGRLQLGRSKKHDLLTKLLGEQIQTAQHLEELAEGQDGNLANKIAVFRFDGNDFGTKALECRRPEAYRVFSATIQSQQSEFFRTLLLDEHGHLRRYWLTPQGKLRLEVVVYGGDEVSFITPAKLGWHSLEAFYACAATWPPNTTYCGGLVFCHHNAPIHAIKRLAGGLADWAKKAHQGRKGNEAAYQVLESFDDVGQDLGDFMHKRYGVIGHRALVSLPDIQAIERGIDQWRSHLSKRKLYDLAQRVLAGKASDITFESAMAELLDAKPRHAVTIATKLRPLYERLQNGLFVHLLELWDYAGVAPAKGGA